MNKKENSEVKRDPSDMMKESRNKALVMQRKQRLQALVHKRKANLSYLVKVHEGGVFWLNCIHLSNEDILKYSYAVPKNRTLSFYYLSASTSALLALPSGFVTVRAFLQLLEEWEYYCAGTATQSMKFVLAKNSPCSFPATPTPMSQSGYDEELRLPSINKFDNNVVYEYLNTTHVPFELDYIEVLNSLCDSVGALYNKFLSEDCSKSASNYEGILKIDVKIKHHIVNLIAKELTEVSANILKRESKSRRGIRETLEPF